MEVTHESVRARAEASANSRPFHSPVGPDVICDGAYGKLLLSDFEECLWLDGKLQRG